MRLAYADPPYVGQAQKLYHVPEVDHAWLLQQLECNYEGWALSCSAPSLPYVTALLESRGLSALAGDYRIGSWVKPFAIFKPNVTRAYTWEPVIFRGGRAPTRQEPTVRDHIVENITLRKGLTGAKPRRVCEWICAFLGVQPGDCVDDLFPGTGIFGEVAATFSHERKDGA